jgi:hypothetical protein
MGSIPQATLNQSGIVYVGRKDVSANTKIRKYDLGNQSFIRK